MDYFTKLRLKQEPFSSSPDPAFFYATPRYLECLQKLEIAVRLRRGLNLVLGEVGVGKTTLSRVLLQTFEQEKERFEIHLVLDPGFQSDEEMLIYLLRFFGVRPRSNSTVTDLKDRLQHVLLQRGLREDKIVVLLIDEGQKLSASSLEILRELLNFECNQYKLLQVVVFAQVELWDRIKRMENLLDRINAIVGLRPLSLNETRAMIQHRLVQAGMTPDRVLFHEDAVKKIHKFTGGQPRKIVTLCHHALLRTLILESEQITGPIVKSTLEQIQTLDKIPRSSPPKRRLRMAAAGVLMVILAVAVYAHRDFWIGRLSSDVGRTVVQDELAKLAAEVAHHTPQGLDERSSLSPFAADERQVAPIRPDQNVKTEAFQGAMLSDLSSPSLEIREEVETTSIETPEPQSWSPEAWFNLHPIKVDELADTKEIVVRKGETLSQIVKEHYGVEIDAPLLEALKEANEQLADPNLLIPGQSLILPTLGEQPRGFYSEPVGWFPDEATAAHWAEKSVEGEDAVFVVQTESEGSLSYGVFRGTLSDFHGGPLDDGQMVVWVDESRVLRVFSEP